MIFNVAKIISHVSHYMTLLPGDSLHGTPHGVGLGIKPTPVFLSPADVMTLRIQGWRTTPESRGLRGLGHSALAARGGLE